ncbi:MAG: c-type cytochrome [Nitrospiraceae bacterium]
MKLQRVLTTSACLLIVCWLDGGESSEASGSWRISHLENGQRIYMSGVTAQGRAIQNSHGMEGVGCAMCHGPDGRGGTMHGIPVPNITMRALTDPKGYEHPTGRKRPPYTEESIKAAIVAGIDSGGNRLHPEMPRWTGLTASDLEDLIGFLNTMGMGPPGSQGGSQGL